MPFILFSLRRHLQPSEYVIVHIVIFSYYYVRYYLIYYLLSLEMKRCIDAPSRVRQ